MSELAQFLANGLCKGAMIGLVALGFGLIYTTTRVFHVAHGASHVISGFALYAGVSLAGLPKPAGIILGLAAGVSTGLLMDRGVYQPLVRMSAPPAVVLISSLGALIVAENLLVGIFGNENHTLAAVIAPAREFAGIRLSQNQLAQAITGLAAFACLWLFLRYSTMGKLFRALSDDEPLAEVLGVKVRNVRAMAFGLGSTFAAIGAMLLTLDVGIDPHAGFPAMLSAAVACIIGGARSFLAPFAGGLFLGLVQAVIVWQAGSRWESAATYGVLILFLLVKRDGLFPSVRRPESAK